VLGWSLSRQSAPEKNSWSLLATFIVAKKDFLNFIFFKINDFMFL